MCDHDYGSKAKEVQIQGCGAEPSPILIQQKSPFPWMDLARCQSCCHGFLLALNHCVSDCPLIPTHSPCISAESRPCPGCACCPLHIETLHVTSCAFTNDKCFLSATLSKAQRQIGSSMGTMTSESTSSHSHYMSLKGYGFLLLPSLCTEALVLGPYRVLAEISTTGEQQVHGITG